MQFAHNQRVFGLTAGQWLLKLRVDRAQELLLRTDETIARNALESGYAGRSAFTRQFWRVIGLSPRDCRTAHQNLKEMGRGLQRGLSMPRQPSRETGRCARSRKVRVPLHKTDVTLSRES